MPIEFNCPQCHKLLRTSDSKAGVTAKCPHCGQSVVVPSAAEPPPAAGNEFDFGEPPPEFDDYEQPAAVAPPPMTGRKKTCPMCGETVGPNATRCRHCGESLGPARGPMAASDSSSTALGVASLVCGISSLPFSVCCWFLGMPLALIAFVCGGIALAQGIRGDGGGKGLAIAGMICAGLSVLLFIGLLALGLAANHADNF